MSDYLYHQGFHVLRLQGSDAEMGFRHGQMLRAAIQRGPVPYFRDFLPRMLTPALGVSRARAAAAAFQRTAGQELAARFPPALREHLAGLAEGAEIPLQDVLRAFVLPDLFLWLASLGNRAKRPGAAPLLPLMGCSSAIVQAAASAEGRLMHGRNLDYMGVGYWDAEQAILFYEPDGAIPYVSVSAAGIPFGGVTAMNQAGLSLAVHQHLSSLGVKRGGTPVGVAGDAVMRQASTLKEAAAILDQYPPTACWTYLCSSASEGALLVYETTGRGSRWFITEAPVYGYTNFYHDRELAAQETHLYPSQWRSNLGRYQAICKGLQVRRGELGPEDVASVLGHPGGGCRLSDPVAMLYTVSSAVMLPGEGLVWAAQGPAPVSQRPYVPFDLASRGPRPDLALLNDQPLDPDADAAFDAYRRAYGHWFMEQDGHNALGALESAARLQPRQPLYAYMAGLTALNNRLPDQAIYWLNKAIELGHPHAGRRAGFLLWRGRAYDAVGLRRAAREDYAAALSGEPDTHTRQAATGGLTRPWRWQRIGLEFNYADAM